MRTLIVLFLTIVSVFGQNSYNAYFDMEGGTSGNMVSVANLNSSTHTNGIFGTWTITPSPHTAFFITNVNDTALRAPFLVGSTLYDGISDTKTYCVVVNGSAARECQFDINSTKTGQFALGWYWRVSPSANLGDFVDTIHISTFSGDYAVAAYRNDGGSAKAIRIHTNANGQGGVGPDIVVTSNFTYWCTILYDTNDTVFGRSKLAVFDPTTWRMVGISTLTNAGKSMVNYWKFGHCNGHSASDNELMWFDDFMIKTGPTAVSEWPLLPVGATVQAATTARADFDMAYTNATPNVGTNWDIVKLPTGSSTWSSGYTIAKSVVVSGNGTNNTKIEMDNDTVASIMWTTTGDFVTISNGWFRGTTPVTTGKYNLTLFNLKGNQHRICYNLLSQAMVPVYANFFGCFDNNYVLDCVKLRNIFDHGNVPLNTVFNTYYSPAFDSTNFMFYEDNTFYYSSALNTNVNLGLMTSQNACAWVFRHNNVIMNKAGLDFAEPLLDFHGDDVAGGLLSSMSFQAYSNRWTLLAGNAFGKWADIRGAYSQLYSNQFIHASDHPRFTYREERPTAVPNYHVTGSYNFENYYGPTGTENPADFENISSSDIITGVDIIQARPTTLLVPPYPHLLRHQVSAPPDGGPTPPSNLRFNNRINGLLLRQ